MGEPKKRGRRSDGPERDVERLRMLANYQRRLGRASLAAAIDRATDALEATDG